ncbi:MAG: AMP-binding protein [Cellvibrionaceae bacterium]|nr:AMP-binding protein [Cellvibrionaceae bacterium]
MSANTEVPEYSPRNFVEHLRMLAASRPDDIALVVVDECNGIPVDRPFTYAQLDMHIRALAALLQTKTGKGDRVLLLLSNNEHYAVAFFACLYAGLIAVPAFPPESMREQHLARLSEIARDAEASCILTTRDALGLAGELLRTQNNAVILAVDETDDVLANTWVSHVPDDEDIAFLQYTSGSTSAPKGVMVTLGNLMANERAIGQALSITENDVIVSWLPLFHDMGLIGGLLQPFYRGIRLVLMSPEFFLQKPLRWLEAIARHKGTVSGGPDFSYRLCLERVKEKQIAGLDLSSWRIAFSGAEPVRPDTLMHFTTRFQAAHFRATAVCPCYGLAEATLMVSAGEPGAGMMARAFHDAGLQSSEVVPDTAGKTLVACGKVVSRHRVEIRDMRDRTVCPDTKVGEIWVSGPSVAQGYWRKPEATAETFVEQGHRLWLRTGDLGFMYEGELYIAGRLKDLIIVRGHNLYPQDIEQIIETELDAVRKGRVAAFAVDGANGEGIGVAVEVSRSVQKSVPASKLVGALSETVSGICGEPLSVVLLLNPGGLPKTSSGKLQRNACRQGWLNKNLDVYAIFEHGQFVLGDGGDNESGGECDALEIALRDIWAAVLNRKNLDRNTHFFAAGGNFSGRDTDFGCHPGALGDNLPSKRAVRKPAPVRVRSRNSPSSGPRSVRHVRKHSGFIIGTTPEATTIVTGAATPMVSLAAGSREYRLPHSGGSAFIWVSGPAGISPNPPGSRSTP